MKSDDVSCRIDCLDAKISPYIILISKKERDILNTETLISQFNKNLISQNDCLLKFTDEIQLLRDDKEDLRNKRIKLKEEILTIRLEKFILTQDSNDIDESEIMQKELNINSSLHIIDENISRYASIISDQKEDINKTKALLVEYQKYLLSHNNDIKKLFDEIQELRDEKESLRNSEAIRTKDTANKYAEKLKFLEDSQTNMLNENEKLVSEIECLKSTLSTCACKKDMIEEDCLTLSETEHEKSYDGQWANRCTIYPHFCAASIHNDPVNCHSIMTNYYGKKMRGTLYFCCPSCETAVAATYKDFYDIHWKHLTEFYYSSKNEILKEHINFIRTSKVLQKPSASLVSTSLDQEMIEVDDDDAMEIVGSRKRKSSTHVESVQRTMSATTVSVASQTIENPEKPISRSVISIDVQAEDDAIVRFKMNSDNSFRKLMKTYYDRMGLKYHTLRFLYDGHYVHETNTPASLGMEDNDTIQVFKIPTGVPDYALHAQD